MTVTPSWLNLQRNDLRWGLQLWLLLRLLSWNLTKFLNQLLNILLRQTLNTMQNLINALERLWLSYLLRRLYSLFYRLNNGTFSWNYRRRFNSYVANRSSYSLTHDFRLVRLHLEWLRMRYWLCFIWYFLVS